MGLDFPLSCPPQMAKPSPPLASIVFSLACVCLAAGAGYLFVQGRRGIAYSVVGALLVLIEWFRLRRTVSAWALVPAAFLVVFTRPGFTCLTKLPQLSNPLPSTFTRSTLTAALAFNRACGCIISSPK